MTCEKHRLVFVSARIPRGGKPRRVATLRFLCTECGERFIFKRTKIHRMLLGKTRTYHGSFRTS